MVAVMTGRRIGNVDDAIRKDNREDIVQEKEPHADVEQGEANNDHAHHCTSAKGDLQAVVQALAGGVGRARRGIGGRFHAKVAAQSQRRNHRSERRRARRDSADCKKAMSRKSTKRRAKTDRDDTILLAQIGPRAFANSLGNFDHLRGAFRQSR